MEKLMKWLLTEQGRSGFLMMIYHNLKQLKILEEISTIVRHSKVKYQMANMMDYNTFLFKKQKFFWIKYFEIR